MEFAVVSVAPGQVSFGVLQSYIVNYHSTNTHRIRISHSHLSTNILSNASVFKQNTQKEEEMGRTVPRLSEYSLNTFRIKLLLHLLDLCRNKNNKVRLCQYKHEELKKCSLAMWSCSDEACSHVLQNSEKMTRQCLRPKWTAS